MLRKGLVLLLGLGVLAATGVASPTPCCTLQELSRPASTEVRDCCDKADCCRIEKRGPSQAALSVRVPETGVIIAQLWLLAGYPGWADQNAFVSPAALASGPRPSSDHPPPRGGRDIHLRTSLLRL